MEIRPIRNDDDYRNAMREIERLFDAEEGTEEFDRLDLLATLVENYEHRVYPIDPPDPIAAIEYEMEKRGLSRHDLEPMIGASGRVSEVLTGKRKLTLPMIRKLNAQLGIPLEVLVQEYAVAPRARVNSQYDFHDRRESVASYG